MATELLLMRQGNGLVAAEQSSHDAICAMKHKEYVTATVRRNRNPKHHRKLFSLLKVVKEATTAYPTTDDLLDDLKIATGYFVMRTTVDGFSYPKPKSISFGSMDQQSFAEWYERALDVVVGRILPNIQRQEIVEQINSIITGEA